MTGIEYDLWFYENGLAICEDYLLSSELFWPLSGKSPTGIAAQTPFTLGNLLLSMSRLKAGALQPGQRTQFDKLDQALYTLHQHWEVAWEQKCKRSFHFRIGQWRDYLEEYRTESEDRAGQYPYEVRTRVILELLRGDLKGLDRAQEELLAGLDVLLRTWLVPGEFIWEKAVEAGFERQKFWYLYGALPFHRV